MKDAEKLTRSLDDRLVHVRAVTMRKARQPLNTHIERQTVCVWSNCLKRRQRFCSSETLDCICWYCDLL